MEQVLPKTLSKIDFPRIFSKADFPGTLSKANFPWNSFQNFISDQSVLEVMSDMEQAFPGTLSRILKSHLQLLLLCFENLGRDS